MSGRKARNEPPAVRSEWPGMRTEAARAPGDIGGGEAAEAMRSMLDDDYRYVREAAAAAQEKISSR